MVGQMSRAKFGSLILCDLTIQLAVAANYIGGGRTLSVTLSNHKNRSQRKIYLFLALERVFKFCKELNSRNDKFPH